MKVSPTSIQTARRPARVDQGRHPGDGQGGFRRSPLSPIVKAVPRGGPPRTGRRCPPWREFLSVTTGMTDVAAHIVATYVAGANTADQMATSGFWDC